MQPDKEHLTALFKKYLHNSISEEEVDELFEYIRRAEEDKLLKDLIIQVFYQTKAEENIVDVDWDVLFSRIIERLVQKKDRKAGRVVIWRRVAAAALVLLAGSFMVYLLKDKSPGRHAVVKSEKADLLPGSNKAVLTLGNGQKIVLDSSAKGLLSMQNGTKVIQQNGGLLAYSIQEKAKNKWQKADIQYNTITTPRGGKFEIILPDGSKVWLNAASSLRFPAAFVGDRREVTMTGEAYFEVAPRPRRRGKAVPFIVHVRSPLRKVDVEVLGTHFNVMAYQDEDAVKTTLIEGAVKVSGGRENLLLKPGQEGSVSRGGEVKLVKNVNVMQAVAWKNNLFWFDESGAEEVMKQLSRWYDVDIDIQGKIPDLFTGSIPRSMTFSKVFEALQQAGNMHYTMRDNRTIVVGP